MATNTLAIFMALALHLFYSNVSAAGYGSQDFAIQIDSRPKINFQSEGFEKKLSAAKTKTVRPEINENSLGEFQYSQTDFYEQRPVLSQQNHDLNSLESGYTSVLDQRPGNINQNQVTKTSYGNVQISQPNNDFDFSSVQNNENNRNFDDKFGTGRTPKPIEGVNGQRQVQNVEFGSVHGIGSNALKGTESADEIANRRGRFRIVKNSSERHGEDKLILGNKYIREHDAFSVESNIREEYELTGNKLNTQGHNESPVRSETEQQKKFSGNSNTQGKDQISWGDLMTQKPNQFPANSNNEEQNRISANSYTQGQNQFSANSNNEEQNQFSANSNSQGQNQFSASSNTQGQNQFSANSNTQGQNQFSASSNTQGQNQFSVNSNSQERDQISWGDLMNEKPNQFPANSNNEEQNRISASSNTQGQNQFSVNSNTQGRDQISWSDLMTQEQNQSPVNSNIQSRFPSSKIIEQRPSLGSEESSGNGKNFQNKVNAVYSSTNKRSENIIQGITSTTESSNLDLMASFPNLQSQSFVSNSIVGAQGLTRSAGAFSGLKYRSGGLEN